MFPYLKTIDEFIKDCENICYQFQYDEEEKRYYFTKREEPSSDEERAKKVCVRKCGCNSCRHSCDDETCVERKCDNVPFIVGWLCTYVDKANWGKDKKKLGIGTVYFSEIKAWCQSLCIYMCDVMKKVYKQNQSIKIGLECYLDNYAYEDREQPRVRVDMMIGGYYKNGSEDCKRILLIELKQWSDISIVDNKMKCKWNDKEYLDSPFDQVNDYSSRIKDSIEKKEISEFDISTCVFLHNQERKKEIVVFNETESELFFKGEEDKFADFICEKFDSPAKDNDVFKCFKRSLTTWPIDKVAEILTCKESELEEYESKLHPDQRNLFKALKKRIGTSKKKTIDIVYGTPGSGKTVIAQLLCRYFMDKKPVFAYKNVPPMNAYMDIYIGQLQNMMDEFAKNIVDESNNNLKGCKERIKETIKNMSDLNGVISDTFLYWKEIQEDREVIIFDEAQGFNGRNEEIKKLVDKAKHIIFFWDPMQEVGDNNNFTAAEKLIRKSYSQYFNEPYYLWSQFRCNSEDGYVTWVEQVLNLESHTRKTKSVFKKGEDEPGGLISLNELDSDIEIIFKEEKEFEGKIQKINKKIKSKEIVTIIPPWGCSEVGNNASCRFKSEESKGRYGQLKGGEYGKANTIYGLEYEKTLVILGEELFINKDGVLDVNLDIIKLDDRMGDDSEQKKEYVKRTYRIMLTRGLKKCYVYCANSKVGKYLLSFPNK